MSRCTIREATGAEVAKGFSPIVHDGPRIPVPRYVVVNPDTDGIWTVFGLPQGGDTQAEAVFWAERLASKNDLSYEAPAGWEDVAGRRPGVTVPSPTTNELAEAVEAFLADDDVRQPWDDCSCSYCKRHRELSAALALVSRSAEQTEDARCPLCGHAWRRHDPEDGCCDAHSEEKIGVCDCGRDMAWMHGKIAALSRAALAASRGKEPEGQEREKQERREIGSLALSSENRDASTGASVNEGERP